MKNFFVYEDWPRAAAKRKTCSVRAVAEGRPTNAASNVPAAAMVGKWRIVRASSARAAIRASGLVCSRR